MSALSVQVRDLRTQLEARAEELTTAHADLATAQEAVAAFDGQANAHAEAIEKLNTTHAEAIAEFEAQVSELTEQAATASAEMEAVQTELTQANEQLADPAFSDAAAEGQEPEPVASDADLPNWDAYGKLEGAERVAYWREHKTELSK